MIKNNYISGAAGFGSGACACATNAGWAEREGGKDRATPTRIPSFREIRSKISLENHGGRSGPVVLLLDRDRQTVK
ncbi:MULTISPECIES: hypothetical protein [unclassified Microcoleus]|uniref:hypothetical protein n=1 Tax=unclassified Microcoleus TaxID=2642155 RepID=UPI0025F3A1B7|nr:MULTISPECIES: hypothetical protein [unclassified Microcoleus]